MSGESPAVILFDADGYEVDVIEDSDGYRRLAADTRTISDPFSRDRDKLVSVNFGQSVTATTYYAFIDLDGPGYKHTSGTKVIVGAAGGRAIKSNSGAKWQVTLMVVLRIDGTDADLGILPLASVSLLDTSKFSGDSQVVLFPAVQDFSVSSGEFEKVTDGSQELNVTAVNTGTTVQDVLGNSVTPAVGDVLLRATKISGGGTLGFTYSMQYWVE